MKLCDRCKDRCRNEIILELESELSKECERSAGYQNKIYKLEQKIKYLEGKCNENRNQNKDFPIDDEKSTKQKKGS